jgi:hypothetical protein
VQDTRTGSHCSCDNHADVSNVPRTLAPRPPTPPAITARRHGPGSPSRIRRPGQKTRNDLVIARSASSPDYATPAAPQVVRWVTQRTKERVSDRTRLAASPGPSRRRRAPGPLEIDLHRSLEARQQRHILLWECSFDPAERRPEVELLTLGFGAFLDAVLKPDVQRIIILDAPAVLGLARFTELDERDAFAAITTALGAATTSGRLQVDDPETLARLLLGALTRGEMLIANSATPSETRDSVARTLNAILEGLT